MVRTELQQGHDFSHQTGSHQPTHILGHTRQVLTNPHLISDDAQSLVELLPGNLKLALLEKHASGVDECVRVISAAFG